MPTLMNMTTQNIEQTLTELTKAWVQDNIHDFPLLKTSMLQKEPIPAIMDELRKHIQTLQQQEEARITRDLQVEAIYPLAFIHAITKRRVNRVFARATSHIHQLHADNDVDDLSSVTLEMERGMLASICVGRIGNASHPNLGEITIRLIGSEGAMVIAEPRPEVATYYRNMPEDSFTHARIADENNWLLADHFATAIDSDRETCLDVRTSRAICATVHGALESSRTGKFVSVAGVV